MKSRVELLKRMFGVLQVPEEALLTEGHIEIIAGQKLVINNVRAISEYTEKEVVLILPEGKIRLIGEHLGAKMFSDQKVIIEGQIQTVRFE